MRNLTKLIGLAAGAAAVYTLLTRKREDGTSLWNDITEASKGWSDKVMEYGNRLKDRLMNDVKGPNGEDVFSDMYDRHYYVDDQNRRIYMENA